MYRRASPGVRRRQLPALKPSGGDFNAGRESLRESGYIEEANDLLSATPKGLKAVGAVSPAPSTPAERLAMWCDRLPSPAPEMLRTLAAQGERYMEAEELAAALGKKPSGGHWNSGIALAQQRADRDQTCPAEAGAAAITGRPYSFGNSGYGNTGG
jgi:hypothetical protein